MEMMSDNGGKVFDFNIVLIGFMGCGKTTVSEELRRISGMEIVEMDQVIAKREHMSIPEIFDTHGEEYFRNLETGLLIELQSGEHKIISCGGGVPLRKENIREMKKNGRVVLLTARPDTILERVKKDDERPLLKGNKNIAFIEDMLNTRREKYEAAADLIVHTDDKTVEDIGSEIIKKLREMEEWRYV